MLRAQLSRVHALRDVRAQPSARTHAAGGLAVHAGEGTVFLTDSWFQEGLRDSFSTGDGVVTRSGIVEGADGLTELLARLDARDEIILVVDKQEAIRRFELPGEFIG